MKKIQDVINVDLRTWKSYTEPYEHVIIDDFFDEPLAHFIAHEFPAYDNNIWTSVYDNPIEVKRACNHWDNFPLHIYNAFTYFCSYEFNQILSKHFNVDSLVPDYGLHGGGMHSHKRGGKLNIHKDYSIHPKINMMRHYNIIVYVTPNWKPEWSGGLEMWSHDEKTNKPKELIKTIENKFNRAVIFNTTQNSWHGLPHDLNCPDGVSRNSLAAYYVSEVTEKAENRNRALFVPNESQKTDPSIEEFCEKRSKY